MKNTWAKVKLKTIYKGFWDGPHATPKASNGGPIFLGIKNITEDGRLDFSSIRHISEKDYPKWTKRVVPQTGDIVFTYEASLHRYAILPEGFRGCLGRRVALIRPNNSKIDIRFLLYYFLGNEWREEVSKHLILGATVDRIPLIEFPDFEISLPPLPIQRKIAAILSAYDNLIENNTRRIQILEEMAQTIYRHWFVDFKFPGHEDVPLVDSGTELGLVPEGWDVSRLAEVAKVVDCSHARKPKQVESTNNLLLHVWNVSEAGKLDISKVFTISDDEYKAWARRIEVRHGDCIITKTGRVGAVARIPRNVKAALGRNLVAIRWEEWPVYLIQFLLSTHKEDNVTRLKSSGTIMESLHVKGIERFLVTIPQTRILNKFEALVKPIQDEIDILIEKNRVLHSTRDLLLPRLVSGELDVSELDISGIE